MKKAAQLGILLAMAFAVPAFGQPSNPSIRLVSSAPSGACSGLPNVQVISTGTQYSCAGGTWAAIGGSGTFNALTGDATSTATGGATEVVGLLNNLLPSLSTGYLNWTGTAWALSAVSGGGVTSFAAPSGSWPTWLVPTVTNSTTTPSLAVAASAIPNASLATQTANTVLGALTATTPSGLAVPSCSTTSSVLQWTSGTGFSCATTLSAAIIGSGTLAAARGGTGVSNTASLTLGTSNQNWATLGTGVVKNTTTTGAISDAAFGDITALWTTGGTCSSTTYLRGDGSCITPGGGGTVTGTGTTNYYALWSSSSALGNGHLDDGVTTAATITSTEPIAIAGSGSGSLALNGSSSGSVTQTVPAAAGSPTVTWGSGTGTPAVTASSPLAITTSTGNATCATCVTSAASLTSNAVVIGGGLQASSTISADTTTTHALFATATAPAFRAIATSDLPAIPLSGLATQGANTVLANATSGTASPTAAAIPSGIQNYVAATGYNQATTHQVEAPLLCSDSSASGTAQTCTTAPSFTPASGDCVIYTTTTANTGAGLTLNVNALGAKSVAKWLGTTTLVAGDVPVTKPQLACYDGTDWELSTIGNAPSGGGGLPSGLIGQFVTYAANGTTGVASSAIFTAAGGTTAGTPVGINNTTPIALLDIGAGSVIHIGGGPTTATALSGSCTAVATSCAVTSTTGYTTTGYALMGPNNFTEEIVKYTVLDGTHFTLNARGVCNSGTGTAQTTGALFIPIDEANFECGTNGNGSIAYMHLFNESTFINTGISSTINGYNVATQLRLDGSNVFATNFTGSTFATNSVCSSTASPAVCGSAPSGIVQIATAGTSLVVDTSAITASSACTFAFSTVGLTAPANITTLLLPYMSAVTAGTSFTLTMPVGPTTHPINVMFNCIN